MDSVSVLAVVFFICALVNYGDALCSLGNFPSATTIDEDLPIGAIKRVNWQTDVEWNISEPVDSFVAGWMENDPLDHTAWSLYLNVTGNTNLDLKDCNANDTVNLTLTCGNVSTVLHVQIKPINDKKAIQVNARNIPEFLKENTTTFTSIAEFGSKFVDDDCPKENIVFSLQQRDEASKDPVLDGTKYFEIYPNGTLYLKKNLDYETTICGVRSDAKLVFSIAVKDGSRTDPRLIPMEIDVLDIDDEPPKFIDRSCELKCIACETIAFYGNISYENKGYITVQPPMEAVDIELKNSSLSEMHYHIANVTPNMYENMFEINKYDGRISLTESFQNVTNNTVKEDFTITLSVKAVSNRTGLLTKTVSLNLTINIPPEVTTIATTRLETTTDETTTEKSTTTESVIIVTSPEVRVTHNVTPTPKSTTAKKKDYTWVIAVPVVVGVILVVFITAAYCRKKSGLSRKHQYHLDKKNGTNINMNSVQVEVEKPGSLS